MPIESFLFKPVKKVWGVEATIENLQGLYCLKFLDVDIGGCSSLHYHKIKDETFYIDAGHCVIELGPYGQGLETYYFGKGDKVRLKPFTVHRFMVPIINKFPCRIIEVSTSHSDEDVYRLEDSKILTLSKN